MNELDLLPFWVWLILGVLIGIGFTAGIICWGISSIDKENHKCSCYVDEHHD